MTQCLIYPNTEGGVSVVYQADPAYTLRQLAAMLVPPDTDYAIVDDTALPCKRCYREAWRYINQAVEVDLEAAKGIHINRWRDARAPLLVELDARWMHAMEHADYVEAANIAAKKQELRDVTLTDLSHVTSPAELKEIWPVCLNGV